MNRLLILLPIFLASVPGYGDVVTSGFSTFDFEVTAVSAAGLDISGTAFAPFEDTIEESGATATAIAESIVDAADPMMMGVGDFVTVLADAGAMAVPTESFADALALSEAQVSVFNPGATSVDISFLVTFDAFADSTSTEPPTGGAGSGETELLVAEDGAIRFTRLLTSDVDLMDGLVEDDGTFAFTSTIAAGATVDFDLTATSMSFAEVIPTAVPEPTSSILLIIGSMSVVAYRKKRRK